MTATSPTAPVEPTTAVRARDRGGILDLAFRIYRKKFLTVLAIVAVLYVPAQLVVQLISIWLTGSTWALLGPLSGGAALRTSPNDGTVVSLLVYSLVIGLLPILQDILMYPSQGALTTVLEDNYVGRSVSLARAYRRVQTRIIPLLGLLGLMLLIMLGIFVVPNALVTAFRRLTYDPAALCGIASVEIAAIALYLYLSVRFYLAVPIAMIEDLSPIQALRRSWYLVEGRWWRTFGLLIFTLGLLGLAISYVPILLTQWVAATILHLDSFGNQVVAVVAGSIGSLLFLPIQYLVISIYYFDLRIRDEGYDLELALGRTYPHLSATLPEPGGEEGGS